MSHRFSEGPARSLSDSAHLQNFLLALEYSHFVEDRPQLSNFSLVHDFLELIGRTSGAVDESVQRGSSGVDGRDVGVYFRSVADNFGKNIANTFDVARLS